MTVRWNDPFQPHLAGMREHGHIIIRQMAVVPDGLPLGLADQLGQSALALDQQLVAQIAVVKFDQVDANNTASWPRCLLRSAWKSDVPSWREITPSPSIRNECALMRRAAYTMAGKRSAQSWPLRGKQWTVRHPGAPSAGSRHA